MRRFTTTRRVTVTLLALALGVVLAGCGKTVVLMPTPEGLRTGELDGFSGTPEGEQGVIMTVGYATNRLPRDGRIGYGRKYDDYLRIGAAEIRIGDDPDATWDELVAVSTVQEREKKLPLRLHDVKEYAVVPRDMDPEHPPEDVSVLLQGLDDAIKGLHFDDVMIFVNGARNTFYRSVAQAAQYRHFTGRHSGVISFSWPSTGTIWRYRSDVRIAHDSAALLADLVELLASSTDIRRVNILGYSLGAVVVTEALDLLRNENHDEDENELRARLRIGEVYFAAADMDFQKFVQQLANYQNIVDRVSLTVNVNDTVLRFAQFMHGGTSRAGRPDPDELSEEETNWLLEASASPRFDLIEIESAASAYQALGAHDYWYNNPLVSNDVILQMLINGAPEERGLERAQTLDGSEVWYFPPDYPERAIAAVKTWEQEQRALEAQTGTMEEQ